MCLKYNQTTDERKEFLKDVTREGLKVYKIVGHKNDNRNY